MLAKLALLNLAAISLIACPNATIADDSKKGDHMHLTPADLVGRYDIVSGEKYGQTIPKQEIQNTTALFTEDRVVVYDPDQKEVYGATYTMQPADVSDKGCSIRMVSKLSVDENSSADGLITQEDGYLKLIYALPGGQAPEEFKTDARQLMFVMKKRESEDKAQAR